MWPAALTYVLASDEQRKAQPRDRHTSRVVRKRAARRRDG
jgi:hypothetical protein